jgi:hypothetical protein
VTSYNTRLSIISTQRPQLTASLCALPAQVVNDVGDALAHVPVVGDVVGPFSEALDASELLPTVEDFDGTLQDFKADTLDEARDLVAKADSYIGKAQEAVNILVNE